MTKQTTPRVLASISADKGRLRLRYYWQGQRKVIYMGLDDTPQNRKACEGYLGKLIHDLTFSQFDPNETDKYKPGFKHKPKVSEGIATHSLMYYWSLFVEDKTINVKERTRMYYQDLTNTLLLIDSFTLDYTAIKSLKVKQELLSVTSVNMTRRVLVYLQCLARWVKTNYDVDCRDFEGVYKQLPKPKYNTNPDPNPVSRDERDLILERFYRDDEGAFYYYYVFFLFFTGCRPSEASGLTWENITPNCGHIHFKGSLQHKGGKVIVETTSKNNKTRVFPCSAKLKNLLNGIMPANRSGFVFKKDGKPINYDSVARIWKRLTKDIREGLTPYCCRDTFISLQSLAGVSDAQIAEWCDTSPAMIQKTYRSLRLLQVDIRPVD